MSILQHFKDRYESTQEEEYSLEEYLEICKRTQRPMPRPLREC